jgi:dolichol-phosphate mannosyltransferase
MESQAQNHELVLVIIPTFNERENIEIICEKILNQIINCNVLIIDDNSPDGTGQLADALAHKDTRISVLHREKKMGLGSAYILGFQYALDKNYLSVVTMDADLSHDPIAIAQMQQLSQKYDLIIGSRYIENGAMINWRWYRYLISQMSNYLVKIFLGIPFKDCTGGFKLYSTSLIKKILTEKIFSKGYAFQFEVLYRSIKLNATIIEIPIIFSNRTRGMSKLSFREFLLFGYTIFLLKFRTWNRN